MTYMLLLNCALKLVEETILYCDARSKKHQMTGMLFGRMLGVALLANRSSVCDLLFLYQGVTC